MLSETGRSVQGHLAAAGPRTEGIDVVDFDGCLVGGGDQVQRVVGGGEERNDKDLGRDNIATEAFVVIAGRGLDAERGGAAIASGGCELEAYSASWNETNSPSTIGVTPSFKNSAVSDVSDLNVSDFVAVSGVAGYDEAAVGLLGVGNSMRYQWRAGESDKPV